jgi:transposase InsO family protein
MPWKATGIMSLREEFVRLAQGKGANISLLCRRFGISRKCGHKWINRYDECGVNGLSDRSRRPHCSPRRSSEQVESAVLSVHQEFGRYGWGPHKLHQVLVQRCGARPEQEIPAVSTIGRILDRHGLIDPQRSREHGKMIRFEQEHANDLWQMDFMGHRPMLDGRRCHALTVLDDHSRYSLCLRACSDEQEATVRSVLIELLQQYGQPRRILCDNGSPWGNSYDPEQRYTKLEVWLMLHGIGMTHGRPYHPQTQGKDERFHRTINQELLRWNALRDLPDSQRQFDQFRQVYNHVRPHEALELNTPGSRYRVSQRRYDPNPPEPSYWPGDAVRKVDAMGKISYRGRCWRVGKAFAGRYVGLRSTDEDGVLKVIFADQEIGTMDERVASSSRGAGPPLAPAAALPALAAARPRDPTKSVTHVSGQSLPLTPD